MPDSDHPAPDGAPTRPVGPPAPAPPRPTRRGVLRWTSAVATAAVVVALIGVALLTRPVRSPLQDCGTAIGFLLDGRTDVYGDPAHPPKGATKADVEATNAKPCRPRVADAARPGGIAVAGGVVVASAAALVEVAARWRLHRKAVALVRTTGPAPSA